MLETTNQIGHAMQPYVSSDQSWESTLHKASDKASDKWRTKSGLATSGESSAADTQEECYAGILSLCWDSTIDSTDSWELIDDIFSNKDLTASQVSHQSDPAINSTLHVGDSVDGIVRKRPAAVMLERWLLDSDSSPCWLYSNKEIRSGAKNIATEQGLDDLNQSYFWTSRLSVPEQSTINDRRAIIAHYSIDMEVKYADPFC
jgi:hypothetical protein